MKLKKLSKLPKLRKIEKSAKSAKSTKGVKLKKFKKPKILLRSFKKYITHKCDFISSEGKQCKNGAVGKGTLCKQHGGDPIIKENMIPITAERSLINNPMKFLPAVHPLQYIELSRTGMSKVEIAAHMEVSVQSLQNWAEKFESFHLATEIGDAMHEAWWLERGKGGLDSRNFNTGLFKFLTSNKLGYSDKMETKSTNLNIHGVLLAPDAVTEDEWENEDVIDV